MNVISKNSTIPAVISGTSGLGNLYVALDEGTKLEIVREWITRCQGQMVFDTAGKYGAGLALESLGKCLRTLGVEPEDVIISNKLGWLRTELQTAEPTFEPGVWKDLKHDAVQKISYQGIIECFEQGNELLGGYNAKYVSVHDPDEYLAKARNDEEEDELYSDILKAYEALADLKTVGKVQSIGVGAKDWSIIQRISEDVRLDWVMIANSFTIMNHPEALSDFIEQLSGWGIKIINSAVFHGGFLTGGDYLDYKLIKPDSVRNNRIFTWRQEFFEVCRLYKVNPAEACVQFALSPPGVVSVALSTSSPRRVKENMEMISTRIPSAFWQALKDKGLINKNYKYL